MSTHLNNSWDELFEEEVNKEYFKKLRETIIDEYRNYTVYPPKKDILSAFGYTDYHNVKVVIIGQDPYISPNQAHGLCFSVNEGVKCPPSLVNIYKALEYDLQIPPTTNGELVGWAKQGVLLLNSVLTARAGASGSHAKIGWERFTDNVIELLEKNDNPIVYLLWGSFAKSKAKLIHNPNHLILTSVHPSPLSFFNGFLECKHFSKANDYLTAHNTTPIKWEIRSSKEYDMAFNSEKI